MVVIEGQDDKLVASVRGSSFCREIHEARLPEGFKLPNIEAYEGKVDPQD